MKYAENHTQNREGGERPIFAAVRDGLRGADGWFRHYIDRGMFTVDPETGRFVRK
jgi:hypothetical protein